MTVSRLNYFGLLDLYLQQNQFIENKVKIIAKNNTGQELTIRGQIAEVFSSQNNPQMLAKVILMNIDNVRAVKLDLNASVVEVPKNEFRLALDVSEILRASMCNVSERLEKLPLYTCSIIEVKKDYIPSLREVLTSTKLELLVPAEKPVVRSSECNKLIFDGPNDFLGGN